MDTVYVLRYFIQFYKLQYCFCYTKLCTTFSKRKYDIKLHTRMLGRLSVTYLTRGGPRRDKDGAIPLVLAVELKGSRLLSSCPR